jgi:hypothetical protein
MGSHQELQTPGRLRELMFSLHLPSRSLHRTDTSFCSYRNTRFTSDIGYQHRWENAPGNAGHFVRQRFWTSQARTEFETARSVINRIIKKFKSPSGSKTSTLMLSSSQPSGTSRGTDMTQPERRSHRSPASNRTTAYSCFAFAEDCDGYRLRFILCHFLPL